MNLFKIFGIALLCFDIVWIMLLIGVYSYSAGRYKTESKRERLSKIFFPLFIWGVPILLSITYIIFNLANN